jgi:uncharacterized protein (DUF305 family)
MKAFQALLLATLAMSPFAGRATAQDAHHPPGPAQPVPPPTTPGAAAPGAGHGMGMMGPEMMRGMHGEGGMMAPGGACAEMMAGMHHQGRAGDMAGPTDPVEAAFAAINRRMHEAMASQTPGDPDRTFAEAMIAHHRGAVDMAKVVLAFGADPQIRNLAEQVIKAQEQEITFLQQWLATHPQR